MTPVSVWANCPTDIQSKWLRNDRGGDQSLHFETILSMLPYKSILLLLLSLSLISPVSSVAHRGRTSSPGTGVPVDNYGTGSLPGSGEPELPVIDVGVKDITETSEDEVENTEDKVVETNSASAVETNSFSSDNSGNSDATKDSGDSDATKDSGDSNALDDSGDSEVSNTARASTSGKGKFKFSKKSSSPSAQPTSKGKSKGGKGGKGGKAGKGGKGDAAPRDDKSAEPRDDTSEKDKKREKEDKKEEEAAKRHEANDAKALAKDEKAREKADRKLEEDTKKNEAKVAKAVDDKDRKEEAASEREAQNVYGKDEAAAKKQEVDEKKKAYRPENYDQLDERPPDTVEDKCLRDDDGNFLESYQSVDCRPKRVFKDPTMIYNAGEELIKLAILDGGPVSVGFITYSDFSSFSGDGVYISDQKTRKGAHAITLFGWGVKDGVKFWWAKNSYGDNWPYPGSKGVFKFLRGENHCGIENSVDFVYVSKKELEKSRRLKTEKDLPFCPKPALSPQLIKSNPTTSCLRVIESGTGCTVKNICDKSIKYALDVTTSKNKCGYLGPQKNDPPTLKPGSSDEFPDYTSCCVSHEETDDSVVSEPGGCIEADLDEKDGVCGVKNICDYPVKFYVDPSTNKFFMLTPKAGPYNVGATIAQCKEKSLFSEKL
eukprot:g11373.t1